MLLRPKKLLTVSRANNFNMPQEIDQCGSVCPDAGSDCETIDLFYLALLTFIKIQTQQEY